MQYYTEINSYHDKHRCAVTLGKFDSLHKGHMKLVHNVQKYAKENDLKSMVFAFDMGKDTLLTNEERRKYLEDKVDFMIECPFTEEIKQMEAEAFIEEILVNKLHALYIVVGTDFRFGYGARGDVNMLKTYAQHGKFHLDVVQKEAYRGRPISSTYIRETLQKGEIALSNQLLGYNYSMSGVVEHGKQLGRTLGFPTMNVAPKDRKIMPKAGVYACRILIDDVWYNGIGNVGVKPTVTDEKRILVEVYVFDYEGDAYGQKVMIEFCSFERPETKFDSIDELKRQVNNDIRYGKEYFNSIK